MVSINFTDLRGSGWLVLYPEVLFNSSGEVGRWNQKNAVELRGNLIYYAPWRTGRLRRSIRVIERRSGPLQRTINVRIGAKYAAFTDQGTRPIITAGGRIMPVGRSQGASGRLSFSGGKPGYTYTRQVRGQSGTRWVGRAVRDVPAFSRYTG